MGLSSSSASCWMPSGVNWVSFKHEIINAPFVSTYEYNNNIIIIWHLYWARTNMRGQEGKYNNICTFVSIQSCIHILNDQYRNIVKDYLCLSFVCIYPYAYGDHNDILHFTSVRQNYIFDISHLKLIFIHYDNTITYCAP